jgi:hypothetical protein
MDSVTVEKYITADDWIAALESGQYMQTKGKLAEFVDPHDPTSVMSYCCLGVCYQVTGSPWHVTEVTLEQVEDEDGDGSYEEPDTTFALETNQGADDQLSTYHHDVLVRMFPELETPMNGYSTRTADFESVLIYANDTIQAPFTEIAAFLRGYRANPDAFWKHYGVLAKSEGGDMASSNYFNRNQTNRQLFETYSAKGDALRDAA